MTDGAVLCDLSEFVANPVRTGIQRVTYEIVSRWPGSRRLVPVRVHNDGRMMLLPETMLADMSRFFSKGGKDKALRERIMSYATKGGTALNPKSIEGYHALLNTELFFSEPRINFYMELLPRFGDRTFVMYYDWLPWLHPELFPYGAPIGTMKYLVLARHVRNKCFISEKTKRDYYTRIVRQDAAAGPVLPLGSDALGTAKPNFSPSRKQFICLGTIEPRKNHVRILDAFDKLWGKGLDVSLVFAGRLGWANETLLGRIAKLQKEEPRFEWRRDLDDKAVSQLVRNGRATIYVSEMEGYGLPPMESLSLGVPAIVCQSIPSVEMIEPLGQVRIPKAEPNAIAEAVRSLMDDGFAAIKYDEIPALTLPTWDELSRQVAQWVDTAAGRPRTYVQ